MEGMKGLEKEKEKEKDDRAYDHDDIEDSYYYSRDAPRIPLVRSFLSPSGLASPELGEMMLKSGGGAGGGGGGEWSRNYGENTYASEDIHGGEELSSSPMFHRQSASLSSNVDPELPPHLYLRGA